MVKIATGDEARSLLSDSEFRNAWSALYDDCPWATAFQSLGFALTWYGVYSAQVSPVLVYEQEKSGKLTGLLPLAARAKTGQLSVAGGHQAEYHAWLAPDGADNSFIETALVELRRVFPNELLVFKYLPPFAPLNWCHYSQPMGRYVRVESRRRPLLSLGDGSQFSQDLRKKNMKNGLNRLKRRGEVAFEHITDGAALEAIFPTVASYYDLRQGALYHALPFQDDPLKETFHRRLLEVPGLLHVSALKTGDEVVAAHLGVAGRGTLHLGIPAHSPFDARLSPSVLHLLLLGQHLAAAGFHTLDLTPGDDPWKERFATKHDNVTELTVLFSRRQVLGEETRTRVKFFVKMSMAAVGIKPEAVKRHASRIKQLHPLSIASSVVRRCKAVIGSRAAVRVYTYLREQALAIKTASPARRDSLEDLLSIQSLSGVSDPHRLLALALQRFEDGHHFYSVLGKDGRLRSAWLAEQLDRVSPSETREDINLPANSAVIYDYPKDSNEVGEEVLACWMRQMARDAFGIDSTKQVCVAVPEDRTGLISAVKAAGFRDNCELRIAASADKPAVPIGQS